MATMTVDARTANQGTTATIAQRKAREARKAARVDPTRAAMTAMAAGNPQEMMVTTARNHQADATGDVMNMIAEIRLLLGERRKGTKSEYPLFPAMRPNARHG